jgi:carbonic anhydrase/acetyltransferase-like protein (isoleucine patch superfamily)
VEVGAIVIVETGSGGGDRPSDFRDQSIAARLADGPLPFVDLLGQSVLERNIELFLAAKPRATSLVVQARALPELPIFRRSFPDLNVRVTDEIWPAVAQTLKSYSEDGIRCAFIAKPSAYLEPEMPDMVEFHSEGDRSVTRASDRDGPLDFWVADCETEGQKNGAALKLALTDPDFLPASYFVRQYVKRIDEPEDCRQLVTDALLSRSSMRPFGQQIRPGVWADEDVQIRRGARIVGPAYLGRQCVIGESALITRCSNIETCSFVDYGTAIEDSSVLPNTYVGMWLDVRHSVLNANKLLSLERGVMVEISDPNLLRSNVVGGKINRRPFVEPETLRAKRSLADSQSYRTNVQPVKTTTEFES